MTSSIQQRLSQFFLSYLATAFAVGAVVCLIAILFTGESVPH